MSMTSAEEPSVSPESDIMRRGFDQGEEVYALFKEQGPITDHARPAEIALNPESPRTLKGLIGELGERELDLALGLYSQEEEDSTPLSEEKLRKIEEELQLIKAVFRGITAAAREDGNDEVADFVQSAFLDPASPISFLKE